MLCEMQYFDALKIDRCQSSDCFRKKKKYRKVSNRSIFRYKQVYVLGLFYFFNMHSFEVDPVHVSLTTMDIP